MTPVTFIMLDGVRPDALMRAACPHLTAFRQKGASTLTAQSVMPSITLPCHTSIFHSVPPTRHGITTNTWSPMARPLPGLVEVAHAARLKTAFIYNWEPLRDLSRPENLSFAWFRDAAYDANGDDLVTDATVQYLATDQPDFLFVYFGTVDSWGHAHGWMSPEYLRQLERIDALVGRVLAALPTNMVVIIHSDHGGHDRSHGTDSADDLTIPWLAAGPGIKPNHVITTPVSLLDTAPTIVHLLGLTPPPQWEGHCLDEIFNRLIAAP